MSYETMEQKDADNLWTLPERNQMTNEKSVNCPVIQVEVNALDPLCLEHQLVPVNIQTTSQEVVDHLLEKYRIESKEFYLAECVISGDNNDKCYLRAIPQREKVMLIRQKWRKSTNCYFQLRKGTPKETEGKNYYLASSNEFCKQGFSSPDLHNSRSINRRFSLPVLMYQSMNDDNMSCATDELRKKRFLKLDDDDDDLAEYKAAPVTSSSTVITPQAANECNSHKNPDSSSKSLKIVSIEPIVCLPSYSAVKVYPELVYSPDAETFFEEEEEVDGPWDQNDMASHQVKIETVMIKEKYPIKPTKMIVTPLPPSDADDNNYLSSNSEAVLSSADESEMNLLDSITTIFEDKLSMYGVQSSLSDNQLISNQRRRSLVSEAYSHMQKKKSPSFSTSPVKVPRPSSAMDVNSYRKQSSSSIIMSPNHKQHLIDAASDFIFESRQDKSDVIESTDYHHPPPVLVKDVHQGCLHDSDTYSYNDDDVTESDRSSRKISSEPSEELSTEDDSPIYTPTTGKKPAIRRNKSERIKTGIFSIFGRKHNSPSKGRRHRENNDRNLGLLRSYSAHFEREKKI